MKKGKRVQPFIIQENIDEWIKLGEEMQIDPTAALGYKSGRKFERKPLIIGDGAMIRSGTVIYLSTIIGKRLETGHNAVIREQNEIGDDFQIWNNSVIDYGCKIGNRVHIHCNVYVAQFTTLEDEVFMAPGVTVANDMHPGCPDSRNCMKGPHVEYGVQIGVNVTLLPFIRIGARSLIGAGSVVTKDIPPGSVVYGNPAKVHGKVEDLECIKGIRSKPYECR